MEVGDRNSGVEDADDDIVQGMLSFGPYPVLPGMRVPGQRFHRRCSMLAMDRSGSRRRSLGLGWGGLCPLGSFETPSLHF